MIKFKIIAVVMAGLLCGEGAMVVYFAKRSQDLSRKVSGLQQLKPDLEKLNQQEADIRQKYAALQKDYAGLQADRDEILTQAKSLMRQKTKAEEFEASVTQLTKAKEDAAAELEKAQKQNVAVTEKVKELLAKVEILTKERNDLREAYEKARKDDLLKELTDKIALLEKQYSLTLTKLNQSETKAERYKIEELRTRDKIRDLNKKINEGKADVAEALKKNKMLETELKNVPQKFSEIARQNQTLTKQTSEMHYNLGVFYTKNKEYERAIAEFQKVVEINPNDEYAHFNLGYIYAEYMINRKLSIEHFRHYLQLAKSGDQDVDWVRKYLLTWETYEGKTPMK